MMKKLFISIIFLSFMGCVTERQLKREEQIENLKKEVETLKQAKADRADSNVAVDDLKTEQQILTGKLEENLQRSTELKDDFGQLKGQLDRVWESYDSRFKKIEETLANLSTKLKELETKKAETKAKEEAGWDYVNGQNLLKEGNYTEAAQKFISYITRYPKGRNTASAHYYLGETYLKQREWQRAILQFEKFKELYAKDSRVPQVIMKQAQAFVSLGQGENAKLFFNEVIKNYPDSDTARKAKEELKKLK